MTSTPFGDLQASTSCVNSLNQWVINQQKSLQRTSFSLSKFEINISLKSDLLFGLLTQISLRSSTILYFSADRLNCAQFPSLKRAHILRDIPNSITLQTTLRLLPIPVGLLVLPCIRECRLYPVTIPTPFFPPCPGQRNRRRSVPVPVTGVRYNSLL